MTVVIRPASVGDLARVQALNAALFEWDRERDPNMNFDWPYEKAGECYFRERINGSGVCFVAEFSEEVIGYLAGALRGTEGWRMALRSEVENMFVAPVHRRSGAGRQLMDAFFSWSKAAGAQQVLVEAFWGNASAVAFYKANGFNEVALSLHAEL